MRTENRKLILILFLILALSFFLRFWRISLISDYVFDEVYFAKFAQNLLDHQIFFDVHPPVSKLIIAFFIKVLGSNSLGWRFGSALFGSLIPLVLFLISRKIFQSTLAGLIVALFIAIDGLAIVESRIAKPDTFLIFFAFLTLWLVLEAVEQKKLWIWFIAGITAGLALGVKWIALGIIVVSLLYAVWKKEQPLKLVVFILALGLIYFSSFWVQNLLLKEPDFSLQKILTWHNQAWGYHLSLKATHPYSSQWWSWPVLLKPVLYYFEAISPRRYAEIVTFSNPLLWYGGVLAVLFMGWETIRQKKWDQWLIPGGFLITYLPFILVQRVMFNYHYFSALVFTFLALSFVLNNILKTPQTRIWGIIYLVLLILSTIAIYPMLVALPTPFVFYK